ncbi:MAG TPA: abortive infection system antitoxin AbiGi family protein [Ignavibacteriaceae bacterium]|nr:abortive infection system antitoxin AbiGi family protein [Ignavibacteriaceae bacterium]
MGTVSSDALFHFTSQPDFLIGILQNEFQPRYCLESIDFKTKNIKVAFPMVCFCDIPLSQIKNHLDTYGYYGIGMKKSWAEKKKLNPILYLRQKSRLTEKINMLFVNTQHNDFDNSALLKKSKEEIRDLLRYVKPYSGDFQRTEKIIKDVIFYNEREWRYIPQLPNDKRYLKEDEFNDNLTRANANSAIQSFQLSFEPDDIKYVFVKKESEIPVMVAALKRIKSKYLPNTVEILTSRIMTCEQIINDF